MRKGATVRATIIIPSYNHRDFVLDAVASALSQTEPAIEVLAIDDGSSDDSAARLAGVADSRLTVLTQANVGLSRTLNRGLEQARGSWVKFLPSDDVLHADCIARQLAAAEGSPGMGIVFALPEVVDAAGLPLADPAPQAWFDTDAQDQAAILRGLLERNFLCAPSALFDRELALAVGGFDPALVIAQDYDLWLKLLSRAPAVLLRERLVGVRWHGANQSAIVTPASEAERARVVVAALERIGLERWVELFRADDPSAPWSGERALAAALQRSGLREVTPFVEQLRGQPAANEARRSPLPVDRSTRDASPSARTTMNPPARMGIGATVRALVGRFAPRPATARAECTIEPGARPEHWLVIAPAEDPVPPLRAWRLADALARSGARVTLAVNSAALAASPAAPVEVAIVPYSLAALRALIGRDERLRVVVQRPDAQVVAFAREAHLKGARVVYDKAEGWGAVARAALDTERALVDTADDLIGTTRPLVKQLVTSRRLVHLLPDGEDDAGWRARALSFRGLAAEPTVTVAVLCAAADDGTAIAACLAALAAGRGDRPYRVVAVDDGVAADVLETLVAREEAQELALVRNALRGRASGCNLALRATASEIVVLLDASRVVPGPGWLEGGIAALLERRVLGALVARKDGDGAGSGWAWLAPRSVLLRVAGFDEAYDPGSFEDLDMEQQLRALGYELAEWSRFAAAPLHRGVSYPTATPAVPVGERHFRSKWRRSPRSPEVARPRKV